MRIGAIMWASHHSVLNAAASELDFVELIAKSSRDLEKDSDRAESFAASLSSCDVLLLYKTGETFWELIDSELRQISGSGKRVPAVCIGYDPTYWANSTVSPEIVTKSQRYVTMGGKENFTNLLRYLAREVCNLEVSYEDPKELPWQGIYHPDAPGVFDSIQEYLEWYPHRDRALVGILFSRFYWANQNCEVEKALVRALEAADLGVIAAFSNTAQDKDSGAEGAAWALKEYFFEHEKGPRAELLIKMISFPITQQAEGSSTAQLLNCSEQENRRTGEQRARRATTGGVEIFKQFGVPVMSPVVSYRKTVSQWREELLGIGQGVAWSISMPELEGVIEPLIAGAIADSDTEQRAPIPDRVTRIARRVAKWVALRRKKPEDRRIAFILHNNPCAGVESSVGGGAHLDTLESVARILARMKQYGYQVEVPASGEELIGTIMERKAISEFRWTPVEEIVEKGGVLAYVSKDEYLEWFEKQEPALKERVVSTWGEPPGQEVNGVPPAMLYEGKIVITGVEYANAVVCVQPKRGCAGPRCDGQVCKILHDPDIPPPHQYFATYSYLENEFGADAIVHVGTHGNLEFLPGKGTGLSASCCPDAAIGTLPHLYIYNADNPAEGVIAKRRSYATLVDHMQTVLRAGGLYDKLEEVDRLLAEYQQAKIGDKARAHALEHLILDAIRSAKLDSEIRLSEDVPFDETVRKTHEALSLIRTSHIQDGMHILGELPQGKRRAQFIFSILKYEQPDSPSLRRTVAEILDFDLEEALAQPGEISAMHNLSYGKLLEEAEHLSTELIDEFLQGGTATAALRRVQVSRRTCSPRSGTDDGGQARRLTVLAQIRERILDISRRIDNSKEIESLLNGFDGGYIPPGPAGLISRGRDDILPTGRNFYSLDPHRVPTKAAWRVGTKLSEAVISKHVREEGHVPENIGIYWTASDIMWADGEGMAQIMHLLGVAPVWQSNGRLKGIEIIPLEKLGRPRIDVTIRLSGILRDQFPNCMEVIDEAIQAVAALDEPLEMNFPRKHVFEKLAEIGESPDNALAWRDATLRLFASKPGTYGAGVQLAIYASAWKDEKDLADIFVYWNGYAYGKGVFGKKAYRELSSSLKSVEVTYNKVVTDEYDLFGCCCYFGTHGGLTAAARVASGKHVKSYYGDTREPQHVQVRDLADEVRRVVRSKLLNPQYIEGLKRHGYKGAGEISKRVGRVYGWEASTQEVDDWIFDDIARKFALDADMRKWFEEKNPWALEEMVRRLLEAHERGLWDADPEVLEKLKDTYMEIEGWLEGAMGDTRGDFQGGAIDVMGFDELKHWKEAIAEAHQSMHGGKDK